MPKPSHKIDGWTPLYVGGAGVGNKRGAEGEEAINFYALLKP